MSRTRTLALALALTGCVAQAAPAAPPRPERFEDPSVPAGPAYAGCTGEERGADGALRAMAHHDARGNRVRYAHRFVDGVATRVETETFTDGRRTGRTLAVRSAPDAPLAEVLSVAVTWRGGAPVEERGADGAVVTVAWDAAGRRTVETRVAPGAAPVTARWSWVDTADGGERATLAWDGWAPTTLTWDAAGRLTARAVGGSVTTFAWADGDLVAWETDGWSVARTLEDGRLVAEDVNGAPFATWTWSCPAEGAGWAGADDADAR